MLIIPDEVVTGALVNAIAVVGRQISKAVASVRKSDDVTTARWFEAFRLTGTLPDQPDLSPATQDRLAGILNGDEIQAALQELLAVRLTDAPETDASLARDAIRLALSAAGPDAARFAEALADYYDDQICSLVARLEAKDPPLLAQIRSEAFSARIVSALHAIARHTAALADAERRRTGGQAQAWPRAGDDPAGTLPIARPAGAVRVSQADPRQLGVHAAISVPGMPDEVPPEYVLRDADVGGHGMRARVAAAADRGGFVLLVGGSSVGKTRCAAEAVRALLPDWWLVHPAGPGEVAALAAAPPPRTVVWLDELQRYLDGEHGLIGGVVRALLTAPAPVVIIATLWPDRYTAYTAVPSPGGADPHGREREVLDLAVVIRIGAQFSPAEQDRARAAAARDRRLALALGAAGYGLTQTLAAAPQLVARWEDAQDANPYAWAVMTAAMDAARLGVRASLPAGLLRAAAPGYCTSAQRAEAPANWFEQALAYATEKLHGAARPGPGRGWHGPDRRLHRGGLPDPTRQ